MWTKFMHILTLLLFLSTLISIKLQSKYCKMMLYLHTNHLKKEFYPIPPLCILLGGSKFVNFSCPHYPTGGVKWTIFYTLQIFRYSKYFMTGIQETVKFNIKYIQLSCFGIAIVIKWYIWKLSRLFKNCPLYPVLPYIKPTWVVHFTPPGKILFFQKQVPSEVILIMFLLSSLHLLTYL